MTEFKENDVVWVNMGISYGWWPATIQSDVTKSKENKSEVKQFTFSTENQDPNTTVDHVKETILVKFFDDEKHEAYRVNDPKLVQKYSCDDKLDLIHQGLVRFANEDVDNKTLVEPRLSQFIKDVEMAEVITDNCPKVAKLLSETAYLDGEPEPSLASAKPKSKKRRRRK